MPIKDREPLDDSEPGLDLDLGFARGGAPRDHARAEALRAVRARAEEWGAPHGFDVVDSNLVRRAENVDVTIRFSRSTPEMCSVHANAIQPAKLSLTVEPKSWTDWIAARLGKRFETAVRAFDEHWHVQTDDERAARRLFDDRVRTALVNHPIWCRVTYSNGRINLDIDSGKERLTGAHLLAATEVATALALARPQPSAAPYR